MLVSAWVLLPRTTRRIELHQRSRDRKADISWQAILSRLWHLALAVRTALLPAAPRPCCIRRAAHWPFLVLFLVDSGSRALFRSSAIQIGRPGKLDSSSRAAIDELGAGGPIAEGDENRGPELGPRGERWLLVKGVTRAGSGWQLRCLQRKGETNPIDELTANPELHGVPTNDTR